MSTVTLTRGQRDVIHYEILLELDGTLGDIATSLKHGDCECVHTYHMRARAERAFRLLDDIGWDRLDARDVYPLTMAADELADYAKDRIEASEGCLRDNTPVFEVAVCGGDPWEKYRDRLGGTLEEDVAALRGVIDVDLDVIGACRSILAQLGWSTRDEADRLTAVRDAF